MAAADTAVGAGVGHRRQAGSTPRRSRRRRLGPSRGPHQAHLTPRPRPRTARARREALTGYLFISPAALLFAVFVILPVLAAVVLSLFNWDILTAPSFAGADNYTRLVSDPLVRKALGNTAMFTVATVILHIVIAFALALAVNQVTSRFLRYFARTTIFFPMLISWAACALIWQYALDPDSGFINYYLGLVGVDAPNWFYSSTWALPAMVMTDLWRTLGYTFVILLAGLQTVPTHLYEAARVDGAGPWRRLWNVTIPMMSPTLLFTGIISIMGAFQIYDPMAIITKGGPGDATLSMVQLIYNTAFRDFQMGYGCAIALLVTAFIMLFTLVQLKLSKKWVTYDR